MSNQKAASTWASLQAQQAMPHSTKKTIMYYWTIWT